MGEIMYKSVILRVIILSLVAVCVWPLSPYAQVQIKEGGSLVSPTNGEEFFAVSVPRNFSQVDAKKNESSWVRVYISPEKPAKQVFLVKSMKSNSKYSSASLFESIDGTTGQDIAKMCSHGLYQNIHLDEKKYADYDMALAWISCAKTQTGTPSSISILAGTIRGKHSGDYYAFEWSERETVSNSPLVFDRGKWLNRYKEVEPFKLCWVTSKQSATDCMKK
jgi:hypothetical protein